MKNYLINTVAVLTFCALVGCQSAPRERVVQVIPGEVVNEYSTDAAITTNVTRALSADSRVSSLPIEVATYKRTVVLSGFVSTLQQKVAAGRAAGKVPGVNLIQNNLIVRR